MRTTPLAATVVRIGTVGPGPGRTARSVHLGVLLDAVLDEVFDHVPEPYRTPSWFRRPEGGHTTLVIPPTVPKGWVATELPRLLAAALRRRNRHLNEYGRLRLRVAIDHGDVVLRPPYFGGAAIARSGWLCDADELAAALAATPAEDHALIVSDGFHTDLAAEAGVEPASFRQVTVRAPGGPEIGWLRTGPVPGRKNRDIAREP